MMNAPIRPDPHDLLDGLPPDQAGIVAQLTAEFSAAGKELVLVGGAVRDLLLGDAADSDLDFATNALPEESTALAAATSPTGAFDVGARFGTIGVVYPTGVGIRPISVEITTYRSEHYPDQSRHPQVTYGSTLLNDLSRRDFTINAMAIDTTSGNLIDPFDGQADLAGSIVRAVGDPHTRFQEDPLRMLRAARFAAQLGFLISRETMIAMRAEAASLERISEERVFAELTRTLTGPYASAGLNALQASSLLTVALPELVLLASEAGQEQQIHLEKDLWQHTLQVIDQSPARASVRWAALLHDAAKPQTRRLDEAGELHFYGHERKGAEMAQQILRRLKADKSLQQDVSLLVELHYRPETYDPGWTDSAVRRLMLEAGDVLPDLLDLAAADVTSARADRQREAAERVAGLRERFDTLNAERALEDFRSPLDGDELMELFQRPPGRWIAVIKDMLRELVIDGELQPEDKQRATELAQLRLDELDC